MYLNKVEGKSFEFLVSNFFLKFSSNNLGVLVVELLNETVTY